MCQIGCSIMSSSAWLQSSIELNSSDPYMHFIDLTEEVFIKYSPRCLFCSCQRCPQACRQVSQWRTTTKIKWWDKGEEKERKEKSNNKKMNRLQKSNPINPIQWNTLQCNPIQSKRIHCNAAQYLFRGHCCHISEHLACKCLMKLNHSNISQGKIHTL